MSFGWAYINCEDIAITNMSGPTGSILVRSDTFEVSGTQNFMLYHEPSTGGPRHNLSLTGSFRQLGDYNVTGAVSVTGSVNVLGPVKMWSDLVVEGNVVANTFDVVHTTLTEVQSSGSTRFGNDTNDTHVITGRTTFAGAGADPYPAMVVTASAAAPGSGNTSYIGLRTKRPPTTLAVSGSFSKQYDPHYIGTTTINLTNNITGSIIGVKNGGAVNITLPTAHATPGRILIIKDESLTQPRTSGNKITVSCQSGEQIDDQNEYYIMGSRAALTLYADGVNQWFIF
tara:strand:- start:10860 stop:11714 length:855 start_codon:yes stop_codon:yes gene_type:complete